MINQATISNQIATLVREVDELKSRAFMTRVTTYRSGSSAGTAFTYSMTSNKRLVVRIKFTPDHDPSAYALFEVYGTPPDAHGPASVNDGTGSYYDLLFKTGIGSTLNVSISSVVSSVDTGTVSYTAVYYA